MPPRALEGPPAVASDQRQVHWVLLVLLGAGYARSVAAEPEPTGQRLTAAQAKALALKVHADATAIDRLPRFSYRIKSGIHFWATWCGPCKNDLPLLKKLAADGLPVIGMHPAGTSAAEVSEVIKDRELGYPTYLATAKTAGDDRKIAGYPVAMFPYCILVDRTGRVAGHGSLGPELIGQLRALLKTA